MTTMQETRVGLDDARAHDAAHAAIRDALAEEGAGFEFVQAMRLLQRLRPERAPVGAWADPADEIVRLSVPPTLAFPQSEIASVQFPADADDPVHVAVRFFGLTGPQGVLPHIYTEHAAARARSRDTAFRDFLDLFQHRALSLFYRAWERHHFTVGAERGDDDRFLAHLLDLAGFGTSQLRDRAGVPAETLAFYAGLLALRSRPAAGLAQLISDYFDVEVGVDQFVGEWRSIAGHGQLAVGEDGDEARLGFGVVGDAIYDPHARVRLRVGPLTRDRFDEFLPGGSAYATLRALARLYADEHAGVEAQLVLARHEVAPCMLGVDDAPTLGFGSWLQVKPMQTDPDDVTILLC